MTAFHKTSKWLGLAVAIQALVLLGLWGAGPSTRTARADGIPDAGAQRDQIIEQLKSIDGKLDKLITLLSSGDVQVKVRATDDANKRD